MKRLLVGSVLLLISSVCLSKDIPLNKEIGLCKTGFSFSCFNVADPEEPGGLNGKEKLVKS